MGLTAQRLTAADEAHAAAALYAARRTDGLPVVVPTPERVARMLDAAGDLEPDVILGAVGPRMGAATVEKVAVNAVMAGCAPDVFPVVMAAVEAVCDPVFTLGPMQVTTHAVTPFVVVNGPAREVLRS